MDKYCPTLKKVQERKAELRLWFFSNFAHVRASLSVREGRCIVTLPDTFRQGGQWAWERKYSRLEVGGKGLFHRRQRSAKTNEVDVEA